MLRSHVVINGLESFTGPEKFGGDLTWDLTWDLDLSLTIFRYNLAAPQLLYGLRLFFLSAQSAHFPCLSPLGLRF